MSFPILYQAHNQLHQEDLTFWLNLAVKFTGPVLEIGCGTGRVLIPLAQAGIHIVGLDIDLEMLRLLKRQLSEKSIAPLNLLQADFTEFHLEKTFSLILLTCNTYTTLSKSQRLKMLRCISNHLQPTGVFTVSVPNPAMLLGLPSRSPAQLEEIFPHPLDGDPVQVSSAWKRNPSNLEFEWHYDHLRSNGEVQRITIQTTQHLTSFSELIEEFTSSGYRIERVWGDFDQSKYSSDSPYLILEASFLKSRQ